MARIVTGCFVALALASCFNPDYGSPGFYCHPTDDPACPDGQSCVNGRCVDDSPSTTTNPFDFAGPKDMASMCLASGAPCKLSTDCCSQTCSAVSGCLGSTGCVQDGQSCSSGSQCCSGTCNGAATCGTSSSCFQDGQSCTFSSDCCSAVCNSFGQCGSSSGCFMSSQPCTDDTQCCSGFCDTFFGDGCL